MPKKKLALYGAGGLGRELQSWFSRLEAYEFVGFFDDGEKRASHGMPLLGGSDALEAFSNDALYIIISVGDPGSRQKIASRLKQFSFLRYPVIIHPHAVIDDVATVKLGEGTVVTAGCILTTNIVIGEHVLLNLNTTVGHDCRIGRYTAVMPGVNLSGQVEIGEGTLIGAGACVLNQVSIGDNTKIGAGAVVTRPVGNNCTAVGVPAKVIAS